MPLSCDAVQAGWPLRRYAESLPRFNIGDRVFHANRRGIYRRGLVITSVHLTDDGEWVYDARGVVGECFLESGRGEPAEGVISGDADTFHPMPKRKKARSKP